MSFSKYEQYRSGGANWVGDIPAHWRVAALRWVARRYAGGTPDKANPAYWSNGTIPWLNSGSVNQRMITEASEYITEDAYSNSSARWVPEGALVMALAGQGKTKGMVAQLAIRATCNQSMAAIVPAAEVNPRYLYWWLDAQYQNIRNLAGGDLRDGLNLDLLGQIPCPLPAKDEQSSISFFLDRETAKIDELVAEQERLIELLDEKRQAVISHAVTKGLDPTTPTIDLGIPWMGSVPIHWRATRIKHLARPGVGGFVDGDWIESPFITTEGVRLLQCGNVGTGVFEEQGFRYVAESTFRQLKCSEVEPGDVLICRLQSSRTILAGRACIAPDLGVRMITSVDNCILKPSAEFDSAYIVYLLSTPEYLGYIEDVARGGTRDRVSRSMLGNVVLAVPPLAEQRQIVDYIRSNTEVTDLLRANSAESIRLLLERRSALISAAVTGQIDVRQLEVA
jgi:type I restriction enzyme S subunit